MRVSRIVAACVVPLLILLLGANAAERPRLTFTGLGDIHIGMSESRARALGFRLTSAGPWGEVGDDDYVACHYLDSAPGYPAIAVMINDHEVVRIDIGYRSLGENWMSLSGARIGMSEQELAAIYGDWLQISPHPYLDEAGSYLSLTSSDGRYAMIFETAAEDFDADALQAGNQPRLVTAFRAGRSGPVGYIEGCA